MKILSIVFAAAVLLAVMPLNASAAKPSKKTVLIVSFTTGFRHDTVGKVPPAGVTNEDAIAPEYDGVAQKTISEIGNKAGIFASKFCRNQEDVIKMLTPEWLDANKIDAVFFANTTGNLHIPDLGKFLNWIKAGHSFLGAHSAGDTYHPKDANGDTGYIDMLSAEFRTHGAQAVADCVVEDTKHPAVAHLGQMYSVKDEIYHYLVNHRADIHVLLSLRKQPMDGVDGKGGQPIDMMIAWTKSYGKGKVFYTALGHRQDVWESAPYQAHLLGALKWSLGMAKGDSKPQGATPPAN